MRGKFKKCLSVLLAVIMLASAAPLGGFVGLELPGLSDLFSFRASAANSGTCGENLTWTLDANGALSISGSGDMANYDYEFPVPWNSYRNQITSVTVGSEVTGIGDYAFAYCDALTEIKISDNVETIGEGAFSCCFGLARITIGSGVKSIGEGAFKNCDALTDALYNGTEENWSRVAVGSDNECLTNVLRFNPNAHTHTYTPWVITTQPTCTQDGLKEKVCLACGDKITETVAKIPHNYIASTVEPTCTEDGYTTHTCSECNDSYTETIPALGHTDTDDDGVCNTCGEELDPTIHCSCNHHKSGIVKFFWKIANFFQKLFKMEKYRYCACGEKHW